MGPIAIVFGVLLTVLGGGLYYRSDMVSVTALIPAFFGIPLIIMGVLARNDNLRMHVMHVAALIGLLGFAIPAFRVIRSLIQNSETFEFNLAVQGQVAMSVLCLLFLILCIKSFIDARIARKAKEAQPPAVN